ncbi:hypothetical protein LX32DRAFT_191381 [Colletotrichum zoysiae]|uniref:Uncharacterized protein n=1 Tax=Colletotrichum zoysiae TaxID=1216348 RepID=A0AAD9H543_9PEZI|nr:hypothetical protein LX32DRAFT_191381 [Colletotrichum zoysiae]
MTRYYIVPNITKKNPSQDNTYRKHFAAKFSVNRDGSGLNFKGYFRAITIYGGEQRLIDKVKACRSKFINFCNSNPTVIQQFRNEARKRGKTTKNKIQPKQILRFSGVSEKPRPWCCGSRPGSS